MRVRKITMAQKKTVKALKKVQKAGKTEDFAVYLNYLLSGQVESEEQAKQVNRVAKRTATASEATVIAKAVAAVLDNKMTQVMEVVQVQNIVLQKLGATDEMFEEAEKEYAEMLDKTRKELEAQAEAAQATEEEPADEAIEVGEVE
jgi:hypothetical protein